MPVSPIPSISDIERIAALPAPAARNLQITQCYHELVLAVRTDCSDNWPTFATWASKQAGQILREENLAFALEDRLEVKEYWK